MDLQSFCVGSRRKVHSFPFLRSAVQSTEKMPKSFQFGVPVNESTAMEETCFKKMPDISCNAPFTFEELTKNQDCHSKKSCFDQFNKFSHFTFSRVVGGFVGSKSQGGSASREPHQVWDVIFRQLVDTAYQATMNNNAQPYFSIGEAVSQSIFGQFNNRRNSTLDFTSFLFARPCDFFTPKKTRNMPSPNDNHFQVSDGSATVEGNIKLNQVLVDAQLSDVNEKNGNVKKSDIQQITSKQSYADVAKTFVTSKLDSVHKSEKHLSNPIMPLSQKQFSMHRYSRKGNDMSNRKGCRLNGSYYFQPSYNNSSQNPHKRSTTMHDKCEELMPSKFARDKPLHVRHVKVENTNFNRMRTKDANNSQSAMLSKDSKDQEGRKRRYNKYRNSNTREKERKNIDLQVQEDVVITCKVPEQYCQNWRCDHNRMPSIHRGRAEFGNQRKEFRAKNFKQTRLHSPPPRTLIPECVKVNKPDVNPLNKETGTPEIRKMHEEILCNHEKSIICGSSNLPRSEDDESSLSSPTVNPVVLPPRIRVSSECSVDSEESVVFERDEHDLDESESDDGLDSSSEYSSAAECDSDAENCDEVDFCYIIASEDINSKINENPYTHDAFSPVADRLKEINARWHKENSCVPKVEKVPQKVHFPCSEKLTKVHPMVHWQFAYRKARRGPWEEIGRDRCRFQSRIERAKLELSHVFDPEHRRRIWKERMCDVGSPQSTFIA